MTGTRKNAPPHDSYPLRTVSALTGLSADLIRAWEKRYGVVAPIRGPRGARLYSAADIAHLRLLARAVAAGRAIGDVARLSRTDLERLGEPAAPAGEPRQNGRVAHLIEHLERFDHAAVSRLLGDALTGLGARAFIDQIAAPLLDAVGERWSSGRLSIADEHLVSASLRGLLASLIQTRARHGRPVVQLATPAGERHEFGLLLTALLALDAGLDVSYLGTDLPASQIATAVTRSNAVLLGLSLVAAENRARAVREVRTIERALPAGVELWLGGRDAAAVAAEVAPSRGLVIDRLSTVEEELARVSASKRHAI